MNIVVHTTKEQAETVMPALGKLSYDEDTGEQHLTCEPWMYILLYLSTPRTRDDHDAACTLYQAWSE